MYKKEKEMYPPVKHWLYNILKQKYPRHKIKVADTSQVKLFKWLESQKFHTFFDDYLTFDIKIDVLGLFYTQNNTKLVFVECKLTPITLKDISQLLGYSKVAQPDYSIILSPRYISKPVNQLLKVYNRNDILEYGRDDNKKIKIAKWDTSRNTILIETLLPSGEFF